MGENPDFSMTFQSESVSHLVVSNSLRPPRTVTHQAPLSMGFSRQEYWSWLPFPSPGDLPDPGIKSKSPVYQTHCLLHWQANSLLLLTWESHGQKSLAGHSPWGRKESDTTEAAMCTLLSPLLTHVPVSDHSDARLIRQSLEQRKVYCRPCKTWRLMP